MAAPGVAAIFLDRDGVLVEDVGPTADPRSLRLLPGVADALTRLHERGYELILVTNQTVVARGIASERDVEAMHEHLDGLLRDAGAPALDAHYSCPHHPEATVERYRVVCECRKPRAGMLLDAARDRGIDLARSFMIGDRITDIAAGQAAGCRTILVRTGRHTDPPIVTAEPLPDDLTPDLTAEDLGAAADLLLAAV